MEKGKRICNAVEELLKRIAQANEIPFHTEDSAPPQDFDKLMGEPAPRANYDFARIIAQALLSQTDGNFVFSPASLCRMLQMLQEGMDRKSAIYKKVRKLIADFHSDMEYLDEDGFTLAHGSSIWYNQTLGEINEDFLDTLEEEYDAEVHPADFSLPYLTKRLINEWASDNTNGKIQSLDVNISPAAMLLVLDAIYLKGKWECPFDPYDTDTATFFNADGSESDIDMMFQHFEEAEYNETGTYQLIQLPYQNTAYRMVLVLPKEGESIESIMATDWMESDTDTCEVELYMPRFKFDNTLPLNEVLTAMGLGAMFEKEHCFPRITCQPAHISQIKQQCMIEVKEDGTEAAAVTIAECEVGCAMLDETQLPPIMRIDRPFAFAIKGRYDELLFMGVVKDMGQA